MSFAKRCKEAVRQSPAAGSGYGGWGGGLQAQMGPPTQQELDIFRQRFPVDDRCIEYLCASSPETQHKVLREFKPPVEGEEDYSRIFMSFVKRCRTETQYSSANSLPPLQSVGANYYAATPQRGGRMPSDAELDMFFT